MFYFKMKKLSKDETINLFLYLDLPEILTLYKKSNKNVCQNKNFWIKKLKQDFGYNYLEISIDNTGNPKEYYEFFHKYKHNYDRFSMAAEEYKTDILKFLIKKDVFINP